MNDGWRSVIVGVRTQSICNDRIKFGKVVDRLLCVSNNQQGLVLYKVSLLKWSLGARLD